MSVFWGASKVTSNRTVPKASSGRRGRTVMARPTARLPSSSGSSSNPKTVPLTIPRKYTATAPASATSTAGASGCKTASNAVVTEVEPAAPTPSAVQLSAPA